MNNYHFFSWETFNLPDWFYHNSTQSIVKPWLRIKRTNCVSPSNSLGVASPRFWQIFVVKDSVVYTQVLTDFFVSFWTDELCLHVFRVAVTLRPFWTGNHWPKFLGWQSVAHASVMIISGRSFWVDNQWPKFLGWQSLTKEFLSTTADRNFFLP